MNGLFVVTIMFAIITLIAGLLWLTARRKLRTKAALPQKAQSTTEPGRSGRLSRGSSRHDTGFEQEPPSIGPSYGALDGAKFSKFITGWITIGALALTLLFLFLSSFTIVSTKNIGIVTSFGKPVDSLTNGAHFKAPWTNVEEMDAAIQTDNYAGDECINVRIANQNTACINASVRWRIKGGDESETQTGDEALALFQDFRSFENVRDGLVKRQLGQAEGEAFKDYDPLETDEEGNLSAPPLSTISENTKDALVAAIGNQVEVMDVIIQLPNYDDNTESRINALQAQIADTRVAIQSQLTAAAQAEANRRLSSSVSNDPNVLVSQCFDLLAQMSDKGQAIPTGFSCWPGGSSAVIVPSAPSAATPSQ